MNTRCLVVAAWVVLALGSAARGQFTPGHVFIAVPDSKGCMNPGFPGGDRIWEVDPETGQVTLFVELSDEQCGGIWGLAFTPDGTRLRASLNQRDQIVEFDTEGNMTVVVDANDGLSSPSHLAYDADGNFYVVMTGDVVGGGRILRFPAGGGPATLFADDSDGIRFSGAIAFAASGDLYHLNGSTGTIVRITPEGNASVFDNLLAYGLTADRTQYVYVGLFDGEIFRYPLGYSWLKKLLANLGLLGPIAMAMSPDDTQIYVATSTQKLFSVATNDGTATLLVEFTDIDPYFSPGGIAVAPPIPPPIPAMSEWALVVLALLLLAGGKIMLRRTRLHSRTVSNSMNICSALKREVR